MHTKAMHVTILSYLTISVSTVSKLLSHKYLRVSLAITPLSINTIIKLGIAINALAASEIFHTNEILSTAPKKIAKTHATR